MPTDNRITIDANGPLYVHADAELIDSDGETLLTDTRMALCRCGLSSNKPLCDGSHDEDFTDEGHIAADHLSTPDDAPEDSPLRIRTTEDGPSWWRAPSRLNPPTRKQSPATAVRSVATAPPAANPSATAAIRSLALRQDDRRPNEPVTAGRTALDEAR